MWRQNSKGWLFCGFFLTVLIRRQLTVLDRLQRKLQNSGFMMQLLPSCQASLSHQHQPQKACSSPTISAAVLWIVAPIWGLTQHGCTMRLLPVIQCIFCLCDWILWCRREMGLKIHYCGPRDLPIVTSNRCCSHISRLLYFWALNEHLVRIYRRQTGPWHRPGFPLTWICQRKNSVSCLRMCSWYPFIRVFWSWPGLKQVLLAMLAPFWHGTIVIASVQHVDLQLRWKTEDTRESVWSKIVEARQVDTSNYKTTLTNSPLPPSVLCCCLLGGRKDIQPIKIPPSQGWFLEDPV